MRSMLGSRQARTVVQVRTSCRLFWLAAGPPLWSNCMSTCTADALCQRVWLVISRLRFVHGQVYVHPLDLGIDEKWRCCRFSIT